MADVTVYYDGACPLCRAEIAHYRRADAEARLGFVDVSCPEATGPDGVSRAAALARFHVRDAGGRVMSGAAGFVAVWAQLPRWRWAARLARLPGVMAALELGYRGFLPVRPVLSGLVRRWRG